MRNKSSVKTDELSLHSECGLMPGGVPSHTLPIRVCAAQRSRDFEAPDLERGIHFRAQVAQAHYESPEQHYPS